MRSRCFICFHSSIETFDRAKITGPRELLSRKKTIHRGSLFFFYEEWRESRLSIFRVSLHFIVFRSSHDIPSHVLSCLPIQSSRCLQTMGGLRVRRTKRLSMPQCFTYYDTTVRYPDPEADTKLQISMDFFPSSHLPCRTLYMSFFFVWGILF